jgi:DNA-binding MarR family transcriptional regulator
MSMRGAPRKTANDNLEPVVSSGAGPDLKLGPLSNFIGFHLRLAQDASFRAFARHTGVRGMQPGRFAALMVLHNNPGITLGELGRAIARDKSTVTPLIQDLKRRGLIERRASKADRRRVHLSLTPAGEALLRQLLQHAKSHDRMLDTLVGGKKAEFIALLRKISDGLG